MKKRDAKPLTLAEHLAAIRARRKPLESDEAQKMGDLSTLKRRWKRLNFPPRTWPDGQWLTTKQVAFCLGVQPLAVQRMIARKELEAEPQGRSFIIPRGSLKLYVEKLRADAQAAGLDDLPGPRPLQKKR